MEKGRVRNDPAFFIDFNVTSCTRESWKLPLYTSLQMVIGERIIFTILSYRLTRDILVMKFKIGKTGKS
jgi:hypothetical protein